MIKRELMHHFNEKNIKEGESVDIVRSLATKHHGLFSELNTSPCLYFRDYFEELSESLHSFALPLVGEKHPSARDSVG